MKKNFTKEQFQPKELNHNYTNKLGDNESMYKLMSNCTNDDENYDEDEDEDDSEYESYSEDGDSTFRMDADVFKMEGRSSKEMKGIEFSLVSDDEDDKEDDYIFKTIKNKFCDEVNSGDDCGEDNHYEAMTTTKKSPVKKTPQLTYQSINHLPTRTISSQLHLSDKTPITASQNHHGDDTCPPSNDGCMVKDADGLGGTTGTRNTPSKPKLYQMTLDFGQKLKEPMVCKQCGLNYNSNQSHDASFHNKYHKQFTSCFSYNVRQMDQVAGSYEDGCVVLLCADVINSPKIVRVMEEVDKELGFVQCQHDASNMKIFVYVKEKKIVGLCMVESVNELMAERMVQRRTAGETGILFQEDRETDMESVMKSDMETDMKSDMKSDIKSDMMIQTTISTKSLMTSPSSLHKLSLSSPNNKSSSSPTASSSSPTASSSSPTASSSSPIASKPHSSQPAPYPPSSPAPPQPPPPSQPTLPPSFFGSSTSKEIAKVGVNRIWVERGQRRKGFASRLLQAVRGFFFFGVPLQPCDFSFCHPTPDGISLATHFTKNPHFLVYSL